MSSLQLLRSVTLSITALVVANLAHATEYECASYDDVRHISLDYPGVKHLCEVSVTKLGKLPEVKWYANNDSTFCSDKFQDLVDKYQSEWNFSCQSWPDRLGISTLSDRHRKLVDSVMKKAIQEGQTATLPYRVTGARISATRLKSKAATVIAAQLFLQNSTDDNRALSNRTYYIEDDGESHTTQVIPELESNITPPEEGYRIDSAIVSAILPSGQLEVSTTVFSPINSEQPLCFGTQYFKPGDSGNLVSVNPHRFICNV